MSLCFLMFYLLGVSSAKTTVCNTITFNNKSQSVSVDHHHSFFINEENSLVKGQKGENGTKGERGDKGEKGKIVHINQTEINHLKHKITGWIVLASKLSCV